MIAVAATQFDETTTFYSNWGPEVDIAAPGGNVRVDQNGDGKPDGVLQNTIVPGNISRTDYLWFMGTSMATPHVAGVAALIVGAGVTKPDAVEAIMLGSARKPKPRVGAGAGAGPTGLLAGRVDDHFGAGLVDADAALGRIQGRRGVGELGLGATLALLGLSFLSRRGRRVDMPGLGFFAALIVGSSGLFVLPWLGSGVLDGADALLRPAFPWQPVGLERPLARGADTAALWTPVVARGALWLRVRRRGGTAVRRGCLDVRHTGDSGLSRSPVAGGERRRVRSGRDRGLSPLTPAVTLTGRYDDPRLSSVNTDLATAFSVSNTPTPVVAQASNSGTLVGFSRLRSCSIGAALGKSRLLY